MATKTLLQLPNAEGGLNLTYFESSHQILMYLMGSVVPIDVDMSYGWESFCGRVM